jgi:hypothetical protein
LGVVFIAMGAVMFTSFWKRPLSSWVGIALVAMMAVSGAGDIWSGRWFSGSLLVAGGHSSPVCRSAAPAISEG